MGLAILTPVLHRPHRIRPLLESVARATPDARVVFLADPDDHPTLAAVAGYVGRGPRNVDLIPVAGNYARKINHGVAITGEPLIFTGADDLEFHAGWLEAAAALMADTIGVVGTNDLCNRRTMRGEHATHSLVARWYAEQGAIDGGGMLHEGYLHEYVDDEFVATAKARHAFAHATGSVVEHLHPMAGKAPTDALYDAQFLRMRQGRKVFRQRQHLWADDAAGTTCGTMMEQPTGRNTMQPSPSTLAATKPSDDRHAAAFRRIDADELRRLAVYTQATPGLRQRAKRELARRGLAR